MLPWSEIAGLAVAAFASATILPLPSEAAFLLFVKAHPELRWLAVGVATVANTLGGLTTYAMGYWLTRKASHAATLKPSALRAVQRFGPLSLLLSWLPVIGDALCFVAGWLRVNFVLAVICMMIGKGARYLALAVV
jgi:membrane protein YqaA with SNARE-associated domain